MSIIINVPFEGKEIMATVSASGQRSRSIYRVIFSNEYENVFYKDVENGKWIEEDLGYTELAQHVGSRIRCRLDGPIHVPKLLVWHSEKWNGREFRFGFTSARQEENRLFEIYDSSKKYLYTLVESDEEGWEMLGNSDLMKGRINQDFLDMVLNVLSEHTTDNADK